EAYPVEVRGHSTTPQEFGFATCTEATFNTNEEGAPNPTKESSTLLVHPRYRECRTTLAAGSFPDEVRTEGCNYRFHAAPPNTREGAIDVVCAPGRAIEVQPLGISDCAFYPRFGGGGIEYVNEAGPPKSVKFNAEVPIRYNGTPGCGLAVGEAEFESTYRG